MVGSVLSAVGNAELHNTRSLAQIDRDPGQTQRKMTGSLEY